MMPRQVSDHALCTECGYDLQSIDVSGVCPECGVAVAASIRISGIFSTRIRVNAVRRAASLIIVSIFCYSIACLLQYIWARYAIERNIVQVLWKRQILSLFGIEKLLYGFSELFLCFVMIAYGGSFQSKRHRNVYYAVGVVLIAVGLGVFYTYLWIAAPAIESLLPVQFIVVSEVNLWGSAIIQLGAALLFISLAVRLTHSVYKSNAVVAAVGHIVVAVIHILHSIVFQQYEFLWFITIDLFNFIQRFIDPSVRLAIVLSANFVLRATKVRPVGKVARSEVA